MRSQLNFFNVAAEQGSACARLEGFRYQPQLIGAEEESALIARFGELSFREFEFRGYLGKRRVVSFGWQYDFSGQKLRKAETIPDFLLDLRRKAAAFGGFDPEELQQASVIEYVQGAGIGWHRDKPVFGEVVGVSLLSPCVLRFRKQVGDKAAKRWDRVNVLTEPRSAYHLSGPARSEWQHSIARVDELRYAITFRNLRQELK